MDTGVIKGRLMSLSARVCLSVVLLKSACVLVGSIRKDPKKRSLRVIYSDLSYSEALTKSSLSTFQDRRELLCRKLFMEIVDNNGHKLHQLLPPLNAITYKTRKNRKFSIPHCKTEIFKFVYQSLRLSVFFKKMKFSISYYIILYFIFYIL